ncbi:MAG: hypothetical protein HGB12_03645 [Bacteroidetes bacterium]|nr:hypothetical protein [Bacteroidota bacterium]
MKKLFKLAIIAIAVISFNACKNSDTPDKVAEKFLNHLNKKEYAEAKKLATTESAASIDMVESFSKMGGDQTAKEVKIEGLKCKVEGEKAACDYTENGEGKKIDLVKKDGKWLVEMKKESPNMNTEPSDSTKTDSIK